MGTEEVDQLVMFGTEGVGKTTLLYRLKIPGWRPDDLSKAIGGLKPGSSKDKEERGASGDGSMEAGQARPLDAGYHYEQIIDTNGHYGIWDVPGNEAMVRMWPLFYRYIKVTACLYLVDASEKGSQDSGMLANARRQMRFLLNEDELRPAAFYLICNVRTRSGEGGAHVAAEEEEEFVETVKGELGVPEIMEQPAQASRFKAAALNLMHDNVEFAMKWSAIMKEINRIKLANNR